MTDAPDFGDVLAASLRDIFPALRSWAGWAIVSVVCASAAGIWVVRLYPTNGQMLRGADAYAFIGGIAAGVLVIVIAQYFALASAVRTVKPKFRMTVGRLFGNLGYALFVGLIVMFGCLLLVIPGLYAFVKLGLAPYLYLLGDRGEDPVKEAKALTRGRFWLTAALFAVVGIAGEIVVYSANVVAELLFAFSPPAVVAVIPLCVAALIAATQFQFNAYVRWAYALKTSSTLSNTGTALPPTVTP